MVRSASDDFQTTEARYMDPRTSEHEPVLRLLLLFKLHAYIDVDLTSIVNMFIRDTGLNDPIVYAVSNATIPTKEFHQRTVSFRNYNFCGPYGS